MGKLEIELVPASTWGINARKVLTKNQWDVVRKKVYRIAKNKCEICGVGGRMDAHEIWSYNDNTLVQKLEGLICLCGKCHSVKHFGRSQLIGREESCIRHMMKVNEWSYTRTKKYISEQTSEWNKRSNKEWDIDIEYLKGYLDECTVRLP